MQQSSTYAFACSKPDSDQGLQRQGVPAQPGRLPPGRPATGEHSSSDCFVKGYNWLDQAIRKNSPAPPVMHSSIFSYLWL